MQNVHGEKGPQIQELTAVVQNTFGFLKGSVELYSESVYNAKRFVCHCPGRVSGYKLLRKPHCVESLLWCVEVHHGEWGQRL